MTENDAKQENLQNQNEIPFIELDKSDLLILIQNFSNLRTGQDQVLWSIIGAFWTTNSVLLVSIFSTNHNIYKVGLIVSLVGIAISWVWNFIQKRALMRIEKYENAIKTIEQKLNLDHNLCAFLPSLNGEIAGHKKAKPARLIMKRFSQFAIGFWILSSLVLIIILFLTNTGY